MGFIILAEYGSLVCLPFCLVSGTIHIITFLVKYCYLIIKIQENKKQITYKIFENQYLIIICILRFVSCNLLLKGVLMAKQRMIVTDDQLLIDMDLLFNAIREANGDWERVEAEMQQYLATIQNMTHGAETEE